MSASAAANDSDDLQSLFDSIVAKQAAGGGMAPDTDAASAAAQPADDLVTRLGQMTRTLHESLRDLGVDQTLKETAADLPDARDRLTYIATLTERAAQRVLNATDIAMPLQAKLSEDANRLAADWARVHAAQMSVDDFRALAQATTAFLADVPAKAQATSAQLHEIMMAQDFQDLTGQVIKRVNELVHRFEHELLRILLENSPVDRRPSGAGSLLNGPVINAAGRADVVTTQAQVDELLESLGF